MLKARIQVLFSVAVFFLLFSGVSFGQDLIVTHKADSFNVRIHKIDQRYIYFTYNSDGKNLKTLMALEEVMHYQRGYYSKSELLPLEENGSPSAGFNKVNIELSFGWSYLLAKINPDAGSALQDYYRDLKTGTHFGLGIDFFPVEHYGVGIRFNQFRTKNETTTYFVDDQGNLFQGTLADDITTTFIGPTFAARYIDPGNTIHFFFNTSLGYLGYNNDATLLVPLSLEGSTFGVYFDSGLDIMIGQNFSLGGKVALLLGSLSEVTLRSGGMTQTLKLDDDNREGLTRLDLSLTLKSHF